MSELKVERKNYCCCATIDRPNALNAINFAVMDALEGLLDELENNSIIRCFIFTGAGEECFVSGGDLQQFHSLKTAEEAENMARRMCNILKRIEQLPCWTIAAVNAPAYGGGCEMTLAFDFRIADPGATFGFTQGKFYLPPGWGGLTRLVECVGRSTALRWLAEARIVDAQTALQHKFINRIADKDIKQEAMEWGARLSKNDRAFIKNLKEGAMRITKQRWEAIEAELKPFTEFWVDDQHQQRVQKFLDRKE